MTSPARSTSSSPTPNGLRTSYSFLARRLGPRRPASSSGARCVGHAGGTGAEHDAGVLHFGLRVGDRYVDPMQLFRPRDLTELVRLVPAGSPSGPAVGVAQSATRLDLDARPLASPPRPDHGARSAGPHSTRVARTTA